MTIQHHLSDELLLAYSAGSLGEGWSLAVATHLSLCPVCRERESRFASIGGVTLADAPVEPVASSALSACLAMLDDEPAAPAVTRTAPSGAGAGGGLPEPLRSFVGSGLDGIRWSLIGPGVRQCMLDVRSGGRARLLRIAPGTALPEHGHNGLEVTMVVAGSFSDEANAFYRGDVAIADQDIHHRQVTGKEEPCVCLTVTDAPLAFRGLLPKIAQRFARI